jgi:hypothetical protein
MSGGHMADLNDIFKDLAKKSGGTFMRSDAVPGQPFPRVFHWQVVTSHESLPKNLKLNKVTGYFPFTEAFKFMICCGGDCTFDSAWGHHLKTNNDQIDEKYKIKCQKENDERLCKVLLDSSVLAKLLITDKVRIEMKHDDDKTTWTLELVDYDDAVCVDRLVGYIELAKAMLGAMLPVCTVQSDGIA